MLSYLKEHKAWAYVGATVLALLAILIVTFACPSTTHPPLRPRDYADIRETDTLHVATEYNSVSFFVQGDTLSGFNYDLIQAFARAHGLQAVIHPEMAFDKCLAGLADGTYDLIANGIPTTSELKDSLLFTIPITLSRLVLIQRRADTETDTTHIKSLLDLGKKTVHVVKNSPYILRLRNLGDEIGDTIYIREIEKYGSEQLIALVAHGDIDYAVCEESIAAAAADSMPQIDTGIAIGFTQFYSWAVSKHSPVLLDSLNAWIKRFKQGKEYRKIYRKYYH